MIIVDVSYQYYFFYALKINDNIVIDWALTNFREK